MQDNIEIYEIIHENIEFFKRIVGGQNFLFFDTVLGLLTGFCMIYHRDFIFQNMLLINHYIGKSIAEFDTRKNIPFGLKPDMEIFLTIAHLDYFFLL